MGRKILEKKGKMWTLAVSRRLYPEHVLFRVLDRWSGKGYFVVDEADGDLLVRAETEDADVAYAFMEDLFKELLEGEQ